MRLVLAIVAALLLSVSFVSKTALAAQNPIVVALNPQPEPPGVRLPPGPCRGPNGKYMKCAIPEGASAKCKDGTFSTQKTRAGACAHHGGVATWINKTA